MNRTPVAISMGDPAGIGPEICLRAMADAEVQAACAPLVFGDLDVLRRVSAAAGVPAPAAAVSLAQWQAGARPGGCGGVVDCGAVAAPAVEPGRVQAACGRAAATYIERAAGAVRDGRAAALVTAPIHKEALRLAGVPYPGHTEMLAALTGVRRYGMMLASDEIVVSLVTIHVPYADVPALITPQAVFDTIDLTAAALRRRGRPEPRLVVCGLNPHAGEHGLFGREELDAIEPAIRRARAAGCEVAGPLPPDTAFLPERRRATDAYVVMYHDQGLIPFKMLAFDRGVNVTLGLPIVRTSVDHGTAFDIAWQGRASPGSLKQAILWALRLAAPVT